MASILEVCNNGADVIDTAIEPLSWGKVHPDIISVQSMLKNEGFEVADIDMNAYMRARTLKAALLRLLDRPAAVAISKTSGLAGIAYWINQNYRLRSDHQLSKHDALVEKLKVWVDEQYAGGRTTALSNEELEEKIAELSGGVLKPRH